MAVINTGSIVNDIRGSVGTETYFRNQGGLVVRERITPADPNTADQQACRAAMTALSQYWSATLTAQQRTDWRKYAHQHPRRDRFGNVQLTNGYTRFVRINFTRYRLDTAVPFAAPPVQAHLHPPQYTFTADDSADTVTIDLAFPTYGGGLANLELFAYGGPEVNAGVGFYNGPWRYVARNEFNGSWSTDPWIIAYPWNLTAAKRVYTRIVAQMSDTGELSEPFQTSVIITA